MASEIPAKSTEPLHCLHAPEHRCSPRRSPISPTKFAFFDAANTLIHVVPSVGYHYAQVAARHGLILDVVAIEAAFRHAWGRVTGQRQTQWEPPYGTTPEEARQFWTALVAECLREAGCKPFPLEHEFYREIFAHFLRGDCWEVYDDVSPALDLLGRAGIAAGVLGNWDSRLRQILGAVGLARRFRAIVLSGEVGCEKPGPAIFHAAEAAAGVPDPACIALIGDDLLADGEGALRAGWRQCLVRRNSSDPVPAPLTSRRTLVEAVESLLAV